ncbi:MAG: hypothetical protein WB508_09335 [Aeromicrobium sp.]|uniref:hypothetical protein n=1 Tax=Aeromicrobium sp. TaxID=1871063 RepID=UPI003C3FA417
MNTTTSLTTSPPDLRHPTLAGLLGLGVYVAAMVAGEAFGLNADSSGTSAGQWAITGLIAVAGLAIGVAFGLRGWTGATQRLARIALGLALASAVLFMAFWSGWPSVFSAVAVGLALEHRRRIGSLDLSVGVAAGLGTLVFVATAIVCVIG